MSLIDLHLNSKLYIRYGFTKINNDLLLISFFGKKKRNTAQLHKFIYIISKNDLVNLPTLTFLLKMCICSFL